MKLNIVQYNPEWENKKINIQKILNLVESIEYNSVIIFPEMTLTGFSMNSSLLAEEIPSSSSNFFSDIAKSKHSHVFAGLITKDKDAFYNSLFHFDAAGNIKCEYRKIHPFTFAKENLHYCAGSKISITNIDKWKIGLTICYDLRFPELYRFYGKEKTHLIINIANWPITRIEHWKVLLKARAIENQCYIVGVNRVGSDSKVEYNGFSSVFDPMGEELLAVANIEGVFSTEIQIDKVKETRQKFPFLEDITLI
jgi:predicted amidohydrolase